MNRKHSFFRSSRFWGLAGTALALYLVVFVFLGKADMSWFMPDTNQIARSIITIWPRMPFFTVQKQPAADGKGEEIYYNVPTRQLTQKELQELGLTNKVVQPAPPK